MGHGDAEIVNIVERVVPTVVSIVVSKRADDIRREIAALTKGVGRGKKRLTLPRIPPEKIDAHGMVAVGGGSGFFVDANGTVLTNKHVISEPNASYTATTSGGETYEAEVLARDPVDDIAILRIQPAHKLPAVPLGDSRTLKLGQTVLAFGNALGIFKDTVSMGIISGLSRAVNAQEDKDAPFKEMRGLIQTDAAINPGNSGGPLVDLGGRVVGVNAAVVAGAQNIGFAIPIRAAERDLADLKRYGRIRRPLLGLRYLMLNEDLRGKYQLPVNYGALVTKGHPIDTAVVPGSPAAAAGIKENDIVLEWNGEEVGMEKTIQDHLESANVGERVALTILRGQKELKIPVTLTERK
ncbi:MAG: trypsin-like peptidase domain-containing protein [Candidatus Jorgensenbacteria bacterium]